MSARVSIQAPAVRCSGGVKPLVPVPTVNPDALARSFDSPRSATTIRSSPASSRCPFAGTAPVPPHHEQVAGRQVAVDDLGGVEGPQGGGERVDHRGDVGRGGHPTGPPGGGDPAAEVATRGQVEDEEGLGTVGLAHLVHGDHVLVRQSAQEPTLEDEPFAQVGVEGVVLGQDLDGDVVVEALVAGPEHRGEGTGPDHPEHGVATDPFGHRASIAHRGVARRWVAASARPRLMRLRTVLTSMPSRSAIAS